MLSIEEYEAGHREMTLDDARRLTERIRIMAHSVADSITKLRGLVAEAKAGNVHVQLGYESWTAYLADVLGDTPMRLARDDRQEVSRMLTDEGMSTRAAAKVLGVDNATVHRDLRGVANATPATAEVEANPDTGEAIEQPTYFDSVDEEREVMAMADMSDEEFERRLETATEEGDASREAILRPAPRTITGLDGKTYQRPEPQKPRPPQRRPITEQFFNATVDLMKAINRIESLLNDDRFKKNAGQMRERNLAELTRAQEVLNQTLTELS